MSQTWLIVIDPQTIFASPTSPWGSPAFPTIIDPIDRMVAAFHGRTIVTRWIPTATRCGSWCDYFDRWTFADRPANDPIFDLVMKLSHGQNDRRSMSPPSASGDLSCQP